MGKLRKILSAVVHGPERFDELVSRIAAVNSSLTEQASGIRTELAERDDRVRTRFEADEQGLRDVEVKVQSAKDRLDGAEQRMASTEKRLDDAEIWVNGAKDRLDNTEIWVNGAKSRVDRIEKTLQEQLNAAGIAEMLCADREILSRMNREMSVEKTVWGDPARIELAPTAAVNACLFNTNSGKITIGDYTFAGSRVSLLAGGHDPELTGFLRRDAELTEGCDITIGRGVWLCSGCTLIGPCSVGDDAVIAAGAVVTPGTEVPAGTIWGGIPARQIGRVQAADDGTEISPAALRALERSGGMLYTAGWSEKSMYPGRPKPGHWMEAEKAEIVTGRKQIRMVYGLDGDGAEIELQGSGGKTRLTLAGQTGEITAEIPLGGNGPEKIRLEKKSGGRIWIRMEAAEEGSGEQ